MNSRTHLNNPRVCDDGYFRTPTGSRFRVAPVRNRVGPPHAMAMAVYPPPLPHSTLRAPGRGGVQGARSDVWLFQSAPDSWLRSVPRTRGRGAALSGRGTTAALNVERGTVGCSRTRRCARRVAAAFGKGRQRLRSALNRVACGCSRTRRCAHRVATADEQHRNARKEPRPCGLRPKSASACCSSHP